MPFEATIPCCIELVSVCIETFTSFESMHLNLTRLHHPRANSLRTLSTFFALLESSLCFTAGTSIRRSRRSSNGPGRAILPYDTIGHKARSRTYPVSFDNMVDHLLTTKIFLWNSCVILPTVGRFSTDPNVASKSYPDGNQPWREFPDIQYLRRLESPSNTEVRSQVA